MKLHYDEATEEFRGEIRSWLEQNQPSAEEMRADPSLSSAHLPPWARAWQRRLFDAGWLVPGWPPELGGRNATPVQQMVYFEEIARSRLTRSCNPQGLSIVTPSLVDFGTEAQKQAYVLPSLRGEIAWCLGMSEPGAGSDLAGLTTRAEVFDDQFVVSGQKVWTSGAHHADLCLCFVRTDPSVPKHAGISVLIIDMKSPGITVRPLPHLTDPNPGHADFNEVFFDSVVVPRENLVGPLNGGWPVAGGSLGHERGMLWIDQASSLERTVGRFVDRVAAPRSDGSRLADDAVVRDQLAQLYIEAQALKFMGYRGFAKFARKQASPEHSVLKLAGSELERRLYLTMTELVGAPSIDVTEPTGRRARDDGPPAVRYLRSFALTIAGGTSEIQRTIIAERVLGLPRR
jgi:alkylation response protein AidB-like acyl-CoA dehydrogenase